jgi:hypothetical protein
MLHLAITVIWSINHITTIRINNTWITMLIIMPIVPFLSLAESSNHESLPAYLNPQTRSSNLKSTSNANNLDEAKDRIGPLGENIHMHRSHSIDFPLSKTATSPA